MDHHHHPHPDRANNARGGVPTHQILTPLTRHTSSAKIHPSAARGKTEKKPRSPSIVSSRDGNGGHGHGRRQRHGEMATGEMNDNELIGGNVLDTFKFNVDSE
ncbi:hypothetical protein DAI22_05g263066 [Oryza sativa Japonica Group]|nr:hypothetical protein DAI22_05g263066 [Oryza sativa Japonica Group]